jgi:hypothetical protein
VETFRGNNRQAAPVFKVPFCFTLTNYGAVRILSGSLDVFVKRVRWTIVILGLLCISSALFIPLADDPGTAFNETDTPVSFIASIISRTHFVVPPGQSVVIPTEQRVWWTTSTVRHEVTLKPEIRSSHSLLSLLCKLLC